MTKPAVPDPFDAARRKNEQHGLVAEFLETLTGERRERLLHVLTERNADGRYVYSARVVSVGAAEWGAKFSRSSVEHWRQLNGR